MGSEPVVATSPASEGVSGAPAQLETGAIINSVVYRDGRRERSVEIEAIPEALAEPGAFVWIGLYEPDEPLLERVQAAFGLHDLAIEDAHRAHQRPKLERYGDSLFAVFRTAQFVGGSERLEFGETHVFVGRNYVVTVRHGSRKAHVGVRGRCEGEPECLALGSGYVLYALLDFVVDQFFPIVEELEEQFERIETDIFDDRIDRATTKQIYDLRSDLVHLKRAVFPLIDVCQRLEKLEGPILPDEIRPYVRDVHDHLLILHDMLENLREMSASALDAHLSLVSIGQSDETRRLASWAAIIAVPTMLAGIYGMNFRNMPELVWRWGYPMTLVVMAVTCGLLYRGFKKSGWL